MITLMTIILCAAFVWCGMKLHVQTANIVIFLVVSGIASLVWVRIINSIGKGPEAKLSFKDIKFDLATFFGTLLIMAALVAGKALM